MATFEMSSSFTEMQINGLLDPNGHPRVLTRNRHVVYFRSTRSDRCQRRPATIEPSQLDLFFLLLHTIKLFLPETICCWSFHPSSVRRLIDRRSRRCGAAAVVCAGLVGSSCRAQVQQPCVDRGEEDLERRDGGAEDVHAHLDLGEDLRVSVVEEDCFAAECSVEAEEAQD
jgi:hypothetical protein